MSQKRIPQYIPGYGASHALLSKEAASDTAIIFVHGFWGKPTSTWGDFSELAREYTPDYPWLATSDIFLYAYDSLNTPIRYNTKRLNDFVNTVWDSSWQEATVREHPKYEDLILVGHSEGGVLIRRLILDRYETIKLATEGANPGADAHALDVLLAPALASDVVLAAHLRLFAPACMGTNFSSYAALASLPLIASAAAANALVKGELLPESPILHNLKRGTEKAHERFPQIRSFFIQPLFGVPDEIVYSESYNEEKLLWEPGCNHRSVCKPTYTYKRPLGFICK